MLCFFETGEHHCLVRLRGIVEEGEVDFAAVRLRCRLTTVGSDRVEGLHRLDSNDTGFLGEGFECLSEVLQRRVASLYMAHDASVTINQSSSYPS